MLNVDTTRDPHSFPKGIECGNLFPLVKNSPPKKCSNILKIGHPGFPWKIQNEPDSKHNVIQST